MSLLELAKKRYSVRQYKEQEIEPEKLEKILNAAHVAPTAANRQPVRLIVVQSEEAKEKLNLAANTFHAPVAIIVCADHSLAWKRPFDGKLTTDIDASILTDHMMLEATDLGLGSVWICYFQPNIIKKEFALPDSLEPVNILAIGYADDTPADSNRHEQTRMPIAELVSYR